MFLPGAYIVIHKLLACNKFYEYKFLRLSCAHWSIITEMGEVLPNTLYLFSALKWVSPNFCVILCLLFNDFYFGHFQKEK